MTLSQALSEGRSRLRDAGLPDAPGDARLLLEFVSGKDRLGLSTAGNEGLSDADASRYFRLVKKRADLVPVQYLTGRTDFMGLPFATAPGVLIPRPDTEYLVEEALKIVEDGERVLDLCTGSGCILLSLMYYKNNIRGTGADISREALSLAARNASALGLQADFVESDMFEALTGPFDYLLCNPPYIPTGEIAGLSEEVRDFEPHQALDGGEDGLKFYRILAKEAKAVLAREAWILMEIGYDEGSKVKAIFEEAGYRETQVIRDLAGKDRVVRCLKN